MVIEKATCYHCGDACVAGSVEFQDKMFCCHGCKSVFELLQSCDLEGYYDRESAPGIKSLKAPEVSAFAYLDDEVVQEKLLSFRSQELAKVRLKLPAIHCPSCIWLIENFYKLVPGVLASRVNFVRREADFSYDPQLVSLRRLVEQLAVIGYTPDLNMGESGKKATSKTDKRLVGQIGVAGFCFGNIMLLSFPEYLSFDAELTPGYRTFFGYLNFVLALPVLLYSARDYLRSAYLAVSRRRINMDVPIALGILALFTRSSYEIFFLGGGGYMDSLAGLLFFLLVGKWFQQKTFDRLSFERNYKSYFPVAVHRIDGDVETTCAVESIRPGDVFRVRTGELIPVDSRILRGRGAIDYGFVTGEAEPVAVSAGEKIYAGGRQTGAAIDLEALKDVDQSYLTGLWNSGEADKEQSRPDEIADRVGRVFTYVIVAIAVGAAAFWAVVDSSLAMNALTAVLIIACPCALALSFPYAFGNAVRYMGRRGFYLKNGRALGRMAEVSHLVFDKTGTLTCDTQAEVLFEGEALTPAERDIVYTVCSQSGHPLSRLISGRLEDASTVEVEDYHEVSGRGITASVSGVEVRVGSAAFAGAPADTHHPLAAQVHVSLGGVYRGLFSVSKSYRPGLSELVSQLKGHYDLYVVSGDNEAERETLEGIFDQKHGMFFNRMPHEKRDFLRDLHRRGATTAMVGDGLNDAAALAESDFGISVADDVFRFAPASDAILAADSFGDLDKLFEYSRRVIKTVKYSFVLSFTYNAVGLFFAVQGLLTPVIAAILMPISSVSVVAFVTIGTGMGYRRIFRKG